MAKITYGKTWWGQQWLKALDNIDNSNRIPRGKTYANKGAVKDFKISEKSISSKVQGSMSQPYKQLLRLMPFKKEEKERIIACIEENPLLLAELLNRKMPQEMNELLLEAGITLFPKDWNSLEMDCSCPDWAVPCKHLAAVIYVVANEIDRNPFILFELRDFDLLGELKKRDMLSSSEHKEKIFCTADAFSKTLPGKGAVNPENYDNLSFSPFESRLSKMLRLLNDEALFYKNGDFKALLKKLYKHTAKTLQAAPEALSEQEEILLRDLKSESAELWMNTEGRISALIYGDDGSEEWIFDEPKSAVQTLMSLLFHTEMAEIWQYPDQWIALHSIWRFAENLIESENYMPRLLETKDGYRIQWIPADIHPEVKSVMNSLSAFCPGNLIAVFDEKLEDSFYFNPEEQIRLICSLFIEERLKIGAKTLYSEIDQYDESVWKLFVGEKQTFNGLGESEIPNSIQLWLKKCYLQHKRFVPLLRIEEVKGDKFSIALQIEDRNLPEQLPVEWDDFIREADKTLKMDMLRDIQLLSEFLPGLSKLTKFNVSEQLIYNSVEFEYIFFEVLPLMEMLGISLLLPKALRRILFPQLSMSLKKEGNESGKTFLSLQSLLSFDWMVALGDELITPEAFAALVKSKSGLVKLRDGYLHLDKQELEKLMKSLKNPPKPSPQELMHAALSGRFRGSDILLDESLKKTLAEFREQKEIALPKGLQANLRPYQHKGFSWLYKNAQLGMGGILADDMGLGKTLQVITFLLKMKEEGNLKKRKALVVVPTTLLSNWMRELVKFAPDLKAAVYHGPQRKFADNFDILITTYGVLRSDEKQLSKKDWAAMIIDEAQNIKNVSTSQTKSVKSIKADIYIAMSGTPVENRLSEYWSVMDFANKGYLGSLSKFSENFGKPIQKYNDQEALEVFRRITAPFVLRRLKSDKTIIQDLPDKIENDCFVNTEPDQTAIYEQTVENALTAIEQTEGIARKGLVLSMMTALKQICNHPWQYLKKGAKNPELSGKALMLFELLDNIRAQGEKVLIFTQYKQTGDLMTVWIRDRYGREPLFLHGGNTRKQRDEMVDDFQNNRQDNIFILSLKAGGTGLNLVGANHVIHFDLWWNPAVEAQATDRAYRIGQQKNVMVYRLLSAGTLEERIDAMLKGKKELANMTVNSGETWLGDLGDKELRELVRLGG